MFPFIVVINIVKKAEYEILRKMKNNGLFKHFWEVSIDYSSPNFQKTTSVMYTKSEHLSLYM